MTWCTKINMKGQDEKIVGVCNDIAHKDPTFSFWTKDGYIFIKSLDKDKAHKRGVILCKKYFKDLDLGYETFELKF